MRQIKLEEARANLGDLIESALNGEEVYIVNNKRRVIKLVPVIGSRPAPRFGSAKNLFSMTDDFDAPLPDFDEYLR